MNILFETSTIHSSPIGRKIFNLQIIIPADQPRGQVIKSEQNQLQLVQALKVDLPDTTIIKLVDKVIRTRHTWASKEKSLTRLDVETELAMLDDGDANDGLDVVRGFDMAEEGDWLMEAMKLFLAKLIDWCWREIPLSKTRFIPLPPESETLDSTTFQTEKDPFLTDFTKGIRF